MSVASSKVSCWLAVCNKLFSTSLVSAERKKELKTLWLGSGLMSTLAWPVVFRLCYVHCHALPEYIVYTI